MVALWYLAAGCGGGGAVDDVDDGDRATAARPCVDLIVFLEPPTPMPRVRDLAGEAAALAGVDVARVVDPEMALAELRRLFAEEPAIVDALVAADLPPSIELAVPAAPARRRVEELFAEKPEVSEVVHGDAVAAVVQPSPRRLDRSCR